MKISSAVAKVSILILVRKVTQLQGVTSERTQKSKMASLLPRCIYGHNGQIRILVPFAVGVVDNIKMATLTTKRTYSGFIRHGSDVPA